jgi:Flp pilus assembly protein TadD
MRPLFRSLATAAVILAFALGASAETFKLRYERLEPQLDELTDRDRDVVSDAINLIKEGEHVLALARLSELKERNPKNSSLRVLASYALLQTGNLLGAFEEAERAHDTPPGDSYRCWFLAKVALLNGKLEICDREIEHVRSDPAMAAEVRELEQELANQ